MHKHLACIEVSNTLLRISCRPPAILLMVLMLRKQPALCKLLFQAGCTMMQMQAPIHVENSEIVRRGTQIDTRCDQHNPHNTLPCLHECELPNKNSPSGTKHKRGTCTLFGT